MWGWNARNIKAQVPPLSNPAPEIESETSDAPVEAEAAPARPRFEDLPPAAQRALIEAQARREALEAERLARPRPREINGRRGQEPVRYGDWEVKGIACDF